MGDLRTALRALAHPGSVLALVVLVLNDHVLKQAWPGLVTGKLSDVAGLVVDLGSGGGVPGWLLAGLRLLAAGLVAATVWMWVACSSETATP